MTDEARHEADAKTEHFSQDQLARIQVTLEEILQQLRQQGRLGIHHDFSYMRLIGAIAQLVVVAILFWTLVGLANLEELAPVASTTLKLLAGMVMQLVALTFFFLDHHDR